MPGRRHPDILSASAWSGLMIPGQLSQTSQYHIQISWFGSSLVEEVSRIGDAITVTVHLTGTWGVGIQHRRCHLRPCRPVQGFPWRSGVTWTPSLSKSAAGIMQTLGSDPGSHVGAVVDRVGHTISVGVHSCIIIISSQAPSVAICSSWSGLGISPQSGVNTPSSSVSTPPHRRHQCHSHRVLLIGLRFEGSCRLHR